MRGCTPLPSRYRVTDVHDVSHYLRVSAGGLMLELYKAVPFMRTQCGEADTDQGYMMRLLFASY